MAMAMLVEPLEASMTVEPGPMMPACQALLRMNRAIRSLVDPLGLSISSLHQMGVSPAFNDSFTSGVWPMLSS